MEILVDIERAPEGETRQTRLAPLPMPSPDASRRRSSGTAGSPGVRLRDLIHYLERDPLLKVGAWAMMVALGFAIVVTVGASLDRPMEVAAANAATSEPASATEPLVRTDPGINPWVERDIPPPKPKATPRPQADPAARTGRRSATGIRTKTRQTT